MTMPSPATAQMKPAPNVSGAGRGPVAGARADHVLRIGQSIIDLGPDAAVATKTYNGQFPGPLLRLSEGKRVVVDIHNDTDSPEQLHWHGQFLDVAVDGAEEESTPFIPP
ncbi:MAG: multicopper oxidase domain-containing protein, partial [Alphaproteobacteria bacterium]|nr:multicopper oxidase domain-containing protein [Alphaproteobacteria bacterium]